MPARSQRNQTAKTGLGEPRHVTVGMMRSALGGKLGDLWLDKHVEEVGPSRVEAAP